MCTTTNKDNFAASVYHPPTFDYYETAFIEFLVNSCESILATSPNARLITAGDINKLDLKSPNLLHNKVAFCNLSRLRQGMTVFWMYF